MLAESPCQCTSCRIRVTGSCAAATKCALSSQYVPACNGEGEPIEGVTQPLTVNFVR